MGLKHLSINQNKKKTLKSLIMNIENYERLRDVFAKMSETSMPKDLRYP